MADKSISVFVFLFFLQCYLVMGQDKPCGNHVVKLEYFRNCAEPKNQNIIVRDFTYTLTDDCKLIPRGCFKVKKSISSAKVEYFVSKPPLKKRGTADLCKILESSDTQKAIEGYKNIPRKCTIAPGDYCITKGSTTIEQLNPTILKILEGTTTGYVNIENEGCFEFKVVVSKK